MALRQAEKLMKKFAIDMAEALQSGKKLEFDWNEEFTYFGNQAKKCPLWYQWMSVAVANFTDTIAAGHYGHAGAGVSFRGHVEDTIFASWLIDSIKNQLRLATRKADCGSSSGRETFRKAFALGVCIKLSSIRKARNTEIPKNALVVVDQKLAERDKFFGSANYRTSRSKAKIGDIDNYYKGIEAGKNVSVNKPIGQESKKCIGSW